MGERAIVPKYDDLFNPLLAAIRTLGGSASIAELEEQVIADLGLGEEDRSQPHDERQTETQYRLAWARTYLKGYGLLDNTQRGVWVLTGKVGEGKSVDQREVVRTMQMRHKTREKTSVVEETLDAPTEEFTWRQELLSELLKLPPAGFERLCQRVLRESGFITVHVTGRSGDGGIDGTGIVRLGGLLSFPVLFQCKRYQGSVGPSAVRDFRGAMVGRAERGLFLTTGTFTREAKTEAMRDGAPLIDLVDGEQLLDKLKELGLGVHVTARTVEDVAVTGEFFANL
ncbi:MAG: restriction endonuclease [Chloroflexi bacterium]|nr:MAG: restriction endonuclease [Chloroflexota bacterium]